MKVSMWEWIFCIIWDSLAWASAFATMIVFLSLLRRPRYEKVREGADMQPDWRAG